MNPLAIPLLSLLFSPVYVSKRQNNTRSYSEKEKLGQGVWFTANLFKLNCQSFFPASLLDLNVFSMRVKFHANKRHLSSTGIYCCYYPITESMNYVSCAEGRLTYIWSVKERFLLFHWLIFYIVKQLIRGNNDTESQVIKCKCNQVAWVRPKKTLWSVRNWITEGEDETGSSTGHVTNEHARPGVRQTNSERKDRLNVVGMWQTVGESTLTSVHMLLGGFQVSHPSSHVHTRMSSLPEGNQVGSVGEVI